MVNGKTSDPSVFLSYAADDRGFAIRIAEALEARGVKVWFDLPLPKGENQILEGISASDYLVLLISPNTERSNWVTFELSIAEQLTARDITIIPVLIADAPIPRSLINYLYLDCREDLGRGIERLIDQISAAPDIDFSRLTPRAFEDLVADLLARLDFTNISRPSATKDVGYDIRADYQRTDPFGLTTTETWLVECKFYQRARADLRTIAQFVVTLSLLERNRGLLVMNSQLTSVALEQLANFKSRTGTEIKVIESPELKRLLIKHRDLIRKYFSKNEAQGDGSNH